VIGDAIAGVIGQIITRVWPDESQKAAALLELEKLKQAGEFKAIDAELQAMQMQADTNKVEAAHASRFVSGWRPAVGWVCVSALAWHYIGRPVASWVLLMCGGDQPIPEVELGDLFVILCGLLGLGGLRTVEKLNGATK
jgi:hypothetical protein